MATFFMTFPALLIAEFFKNGPDGLVYGPVVEKVLGIVEESDVDSGGGRDQGFLPAVAFPYPSFQEIAFDRPAEKLFRHGYHDPVHILSVTLPEAVPQGPVSSPVPF